MTIELEAPALDPELAELLRAPVTAEAPASGLCEGNLVDATVHELDDEFLYVRLSDDQFGRCQIADATLPGDAGLPQVGAPVRVLIERELGEGTWEVAVGKARLLDARAQVEGWPSAGPVDGTITLALRGGFAVDVDGVRCFLPGRDSGIPRSSAFSAVGRALQFDVIRVEDKGTLQPVLSRKRLVGDERAVAESEALGALSVGQIVEGRVRSIMPFGVFVDLGGVDGLCHVSELALQHVDDPRSVVSPGELVRVKILEINPEKRRIGVSRRELLVEDQRAEIGALGAGTEVEGTVTRLADFGAFVELREGVEGLCHISELSWTARPGHPSELLEVGQKVTMKIVSADAETGRIALSLKALTENPWSSLTERAPEGSVVRGAITRIEDYGLFVRVEEGVEGLCHISDLTWTGRPERPSDVAPYTVGQEIDVRVLGVDIERGRIKLGVKQLTDDPWDAAGSRTEVGAVFTAPVVRFDDKSAYLQVAEGLEGRLFVAEVSTERVDSIRAAIRMGQEVEVMTIAADRQRRRLDLSIKAIQARVEAETPRSFSDADSPNPMAAAFARRKGGEGGGDAE
ncbi:MAG: S1 RNA-binding domain-containing protein [Myxococcales bacterium]|nr:S1 RNA-binding domain-containing protein [Myxococcales bacterium]